MTEPSIAGAIPNPSIVLPTGKAVPPLKAGQANAFKAKAGSEHYGNLKKKDADEQLLDNVGAKPTREDAKPVDAEGTGLTLESAFIQAPEGGNEAAMPGQLAQGSQPSAQGAAGASSNEGNNLGGQGFAYAGANALLLAQAETSITAGASASAAATPGDVASNIVPLGILGIVGLGVGAASAAGGSSAPATVARNVDTLAPTLLITSSVAAVKTGETATITFTFSEATSNFVVGDILTSSGSLGNFTAVSSTVYTATFTPTASLGSGSASITVASGNYTDAAGNNGGAGTTPTISIDTLAPTAPVINVVATDGIINAAEVGGVITGTNESGASVALSIAANVRVATVAGTIWSYTLVAADIIAMGEGAETLRATQTDAAGNTSAARTRDVTVDTLAPTATIVMDDVELAAGETSIVTIDFTEAVTNFDNADVTVQNGTLNTLATTNGGITWSGLFTPDIVIVDEITNVVSLANTYTDQAGNVGTVATSGNYTVLAIVLQDAITLSASAFKVGDTSTVTIPFFETSTISATHVVDSLAWNLTYTDGTPDEVRACFLAATNFWSSILTDGITVNLTLGLEALDPKILGGAVSVYASGTYAAFRAAMAGDASSANDALAVAALASGESFGMLLNHNSNNPNGPSSANAYTDNDADANNTTILSTRANAKALGLLGVSSDSDGSITFNSAFAAAGLFDYDRSDGIDAGKIDFLGIAIHEIGHALGFSSGVDVLDQLPGYLDSTYTYVAPLDLYRYSTASTALGIIDWTASKSDKYFSLNNGTTKIASFSTGTIHGDGSPPSHWKDALGLGAMDPTVATGELLNFTNLDLIAFDVIGWNLAAGLTNQVL